MSPALTAELQARAQYRGNPTANVQRPILLDQEDGDYESRNTMKHSSQFPLVVGVFGCAFITAPWSGYSCSTVIAGSEKIEVNSSACPGVNNSECLTAARWL